MRVLIQRVLEASVQVEGQIVGQISHGLLVFVGITHHDDLKDVEWIAKKILGLRIFGDDDDKMNLDIQQVKGKVLLISQFTLHAATKKGNRPSFIEAARPEYAKEIYELLGQQIHDSDVPVEYGVFGGDMKVHLINDGPVTIWIDSKVKE